MDSTTGAWLTAGLLCIGSFFMLVASIGLLRLPDLFTRMHASTKSATLGVACMLLAVAVHFGTLGITTLSLLIIIFFFLTAPVATHMIARAAYLAGVPLWHGSIMDELHGRYDARTRRLASGPSAAADSAQGPAAGPDSEGTA